LKLPSLKRLAPLLAAALVLAGLRLWPHAPLERAVTSSRVVLADDGSLLRMTLADDGQYRLWLPLERISPSLVEALLLKEDRNFYWHPGINPPALLRAALATYSGGQRQGGSTLSMQLARRLWDLNTRQVPGKLQQMALALWLEARYSKHDILEAYLNLAPMGGNIEGAEAASRIYFGKAAAQLSLSEALALAVIPQQPGRRARFGPSKRATALDE
jgi:penicillin-binding protein 1C